MIRLRPFNYGLRIVAMALKNYDRQIFSLFMATFAAQSQVAKPALADLSARHFNGARAATRCGTLSSR